MPKQLRLLLIGMVINVVGASFLWPLNTIYIHDVLGKSLTMAGVVLMLNSASGVLGNLIGGLLFDRFGGYRSILIGVSMTMAAGLGLALNHSWPWYVLFLTLIGFGSGMVFPSMYAMAGSVWPEGGRKPFNYMYVAQNVGVAAGAALGGLVASISFPLTFLANALMYGVFFLLALTTYHRIKVDAGEQKGLLQADKGIKNKAKFTSLLVLCAGFLLCWVAHVQWQTSISSYTQSLDISINQYSFLWTVNGAMIVLAQPLISTAIRYVAKTLKAQIIIGIIIYMVSFVVVANAGQFTGFLVAMIILTIGEMFVWPAVPTVANELAPKGREGFYQGVVNSTATGGRMLGPVLGGFMVDVYNINALFVLLIGLLFMAIFTTMFYDRAIKKEQVNTELTA
ncbi:MDR family MFS transporter [Bacillus pinisoli]|uniref:MDR family MFS transporter n=1 Tax=Bacillus pinisoli TaxID=2901866 RepID=UPI001FF54D8A|nr:MFS transporter [Bacillus pinisoli]